MLPAMLAAALLSAPQVAVSHSEALRAIRKNICNDLQIRIAQKIKNQFQHFGMHCSLLQHIRYPTELAIAHRAPVALGKNGFDTADASRGGFFFGDFEMLAILAELTRVINVRATTNF